MKKFLVLYHSPTSAYEQMSSATPEQMKAGMDAWMAWAKKAGSSLTEMGSPLGNGKKLGSASTSQSDATVTGYSFLQGDSIDDVITRLLKDHPHLSTPGFSIEVFEAMPMPGM